MLIAAGIRASPIIIVKILNSCYIMWQAAEWWSYTSLLTELFFKHTRLQYGLSRRSNFIRVIGHVRIAQSQYGVWHIAEADRDRELVKCIPSFR